MNFLAHAFLAGGSEVAILGSLMGDFVKGPLDGRHGPALSAALALHRHIDVYTDAHPTVGISRSRISPPRRRFAGILVDLFYDHFLARHWDDYSPVPLRQFTARVYGILSVHGDKLPGRLAQIATQMARSDWLASYADLDAVDMAVDRLAQRLTRGDRLLGAADELASNYAALEADFRAFFPDVMGFAGARAARRGE